MEELSQIRRTVTLLERLRYYGRQMLGLRPLNVAVLTHFVSQHWYGLDSPARPMVELETITGQRTTLYSQVF
jgi:hypothetical protein